MEHVDDAPVQSMSTVWARKQVTPAYIVERKQEHTYIIQKLELLLYFLMENMCFDIS